MAIILRYFAEFDSFRGQLRKSGWLAVDCLRINVIKYTSKHDGRDSGLAELLVNLTWRLDVLLCHIFEPVVFCEA